MLNFGIVKTKSARSLPIIFLCLLLFAMAWGSYRAQQRSLPERLSLDLGGTRYNLEAARTLQEKQRGLSGRNFLGTANGMVFIFDEPSSACMWMKDMQFAVDMLWLDSGRRVIATAESLQPSTYPQTYCAPRPAAFVVELPSGALAAAKIKDGSVVELHTD